MKRVLAAAAAFLVCAASAYADIGVTLNKSTVRTGEWITARSAAFIPRR